MNFYVEARIYIFSSMRNLIFFFTFNVVLKLILRCEIAKYFHTKAVSGDIFFT